MNVKETRNVCSSFKYPQNIPKTPNAVIYRILSTQIAIKCKSKSSNIKKKKKKIPKKFQKFSKSLVKHLREAAANATIRWQSKFKKYKQKSYLLVTTASATC